ncbi:hypothetical protein ACJMK2_014654 [Sinanodonta woodiana]|uniref:SUEL-type lectin domain-containing protein n=1 Tax=Sinanodonta woodiana TaxID=1069815 RepID=A0ABD3V3R7_SINWO
MRKSNVKLTFRFVIYLLFLFPELLAKHQDPTDIDIPLKSKDRVEVKSVIYASRENTEYETRKVFEGSNVAIFCSIGMVIEIQLANYHGYCNGYNLLIPFYNAYYGRLMNNCGKACEMNNVTDTAISLCARVNCCSIPADSSVFGDPCPGLWKQLEVTSRCIQPA